MHPSNSLAMADISLCCLSGFAHCFLHSTELRAASMVAYDSVITLPMSLLAPRVKKESLVLGQLHLSDNKCTAIIQYTKSEYVEIYC